MDNTTIINELSSIIAFADELKTKATGLRRKLVSVDSPASPKRGQKGKMLADKMMMNVITNRNKTILRRKQK
ncbi:MAG: hypothetical protein IPJ81_18315 [Chitinophagaceae bacterium]|nr:hypothetical protein [Chitinophagaceae bacterium]